ncbi:hypothetical protein KIS4809_1605 [Bacillus sp. ZZV12-4809]|nr:hypothetical protein KIS4809_1605 [Bacillus sp. ZZV12-4809]
MVFIITIVFSSNALKFSLFIFPEINPYISRDGLFLQKNFQHGLDLEMIFVHNEV